MRSFKEICEEEELSITPNLIRNKTSSYILPKQDIMLFEGDNHWEDWDEVEKELDSFWIWLFAIIVGGIWLLFFIAPQEDYPWWTGIVLGLTIGATFELGRMILDRFSGDYAKEEEAKEHILRCGEDESFEVFRSKNVDEVKLIRLEIEKIMLEGKR